MKACFLASAALLITACSQEAPQPPSPEPEPAVVAEAPVQENQADDPAGPAPATPVEPVPSPAQPAPAVPVQPAVQPVAAERDARIVGIWVNENMINSGGGNFASYTTVMTMELQPDGRVVQYTESIGGFGDWSYDGGRTIDFEGEWRADGRTLSVYAAPLPGFTPAATYSFSGDYLVTQSDMGRLIWQRRG